MAREKRSVVHVIADCQGCDWRSEDYVNGQKKARAHNKKTGHAIHVELGTVYTIQANIGKL